MNNNKILEAELRLLSREISNNQQLERIHVMVSVDTNFSKKKKKRMKRST